MSLNPRLESHKQELNPKPRKQVPATLEKDGEEREGADPAIAVHLLPEPGQQLS